MGKINVLGFEIANLIAAGEVVDRPSSVVKELLENAIDSGANQITVEIKNGGTSFIRVSDNGCGIEFDDLPIAVLRHATSKIKDVSDLDGIITLGFRGEALAAISSVAKVRIISKQRESELGGFLECCGGQITQHNKSGGTDGTTVIVEDIFYNVPARKKFLKKEATEAIAITSVVEKIALAEPDISIRYIQDGFVKYVTPGDGNTVNIIYSLLGRELAKTLIPVEREEMGITVKGYISSPAFIRANRNFENFYINSRYVKSKTAMAAIEQAYQSYIPADRFPFCDLNIKIDPKSVDVNVHPSKLEVKFSNEKAVFDAVYYAVRTALDNSIKRPSMLDGGNDNDYKLNYSQMETPINGRDNPEKRLNKIIFDTKTDIGILRSNGSIDYKEYEKQTEKQGLGILQNSDKVYQYIAEEIKNEGKTPRCDFSDNAQIQKDGNKQVAHGTYPPVPSESENAENRFENKTVPDYRIIGEAFNSFVIAELGDSLYMIDKHAAHERIIFEELKAKMKNSVHTSQILLFPLEIYLTKDELSSLYEWENEIKKTGFSFVIKDGVVTVSEIPAEIEPECAKDMFIAFSSKLSTGEGYAEKTRDGYFEKLLYQASCKAAIKAGRIYEQDHIKWICDKVFTLDNIKFCPHGRPVAFELTKRDLEKQFERIK